MWNVEDPAAKLEISPAQSASELRRPFACGGGLVRSLQERNCPGRENSEHDENADEMRRMKQRSPLAFFPSDRNDDPIKKQEMDRTFRQPAESKKNKRHNPSQPRGFFLLPKAQPKNNRERTKRNVKRLDFD